jgi:hypothetical protein
MRYPIRDSLKLDLVRYQELQGISLMDPVDFENLIGQLFEDMGYKVKTTAVTGDEGVDLFLQKDGIKEVVQCKRFKGNVGAPIVRDLYGAMIHFNAQKSYLVTTGRITQPARDWVAGKPIELIDGTELMKWIGRIRAARKTESSKRASFRMNPLIATSLLSFGLGCVYLFSGNNVPTTKTTQATSLSPSIIDSSQTPTPRPEPTHQSQAVEAMVSAEISPTVSATLEPTSISKATKTPSLAPTVTETELITYYVVGTKKINSRSCPRLDCEVVAVFEPGVTISIIETVQGENVSGSMEWRHFYYKGKSAYIHSSFTSLRPEN